MTPLTAFYPATILLRGSGFRLRTNETAEYGQVIDLSDNTRNDLLIELIAQPHTLGASDVDGVYITFTDVYDPTNTMVVRLRYLEDSNSVSQVRAKGKGQIYTGLNNGVIQNAQEHESGGFMPGTTSARARASICSIPPCGCITTPKRKRSTPDPNGIPRTGWYATSTTLRTLKRHGRALPRARCT